MHTRKVKFAIVRFVVPVPDPRDPDKTVAARRVAFRGQELTVPSGLPESEEARLDRSGALYTEADFAAERAAVARDQAIRRAGGVEAIAAGVPLEVPPPEPAQAEANAAGAPELPDLDTATAEDVAAWLEEASPNAGDTVALATDPETGEPVPDRAALLLEAEEIAHGGDGRSTVTDPLRKIAGGGE